MPTLKSGTSGADRDPRNVTSAPEQRRSGAQSDFLCGFFSDLAGTVGRKDHRREFTPIQSGSIDDLVI